MPFDGILMSALVFELDELLRGGRIEKINQTAKNEVVLSCHTAEGRTDLLLSADPNDPRVHITTQKKDNPKLPPTFCMVLRKHLRGGKITRVYQEGYDRIMSFEIETFDELAGECVKTLTAEIMGKYSNLILRSEDGVIIDSVIHVSRDMSSFREVLPGLPYSPPPSQNKLSVKDTEGIGKALETAAAGISCRKFLLNTISGFSPFLSVSVSDSAGLSPERPVGSLSESEKNGLLHTLKEIGEDLSSGTFLPYIIFESQNGRMMDYHCLRQASGRGFEKHFSTVNMMLDAFYGEKCKWQTIERMKDPLEKRIRDAISKCEKKREIYAEALSRRKECEELKTSGELIKSYIYMIRPGDEKLVCADFYSEDSRDVTIELDRNLSPSANAAAYFKKYKKLKSAIDNSEKLDAECAEEEFYLRNVLLMTENCKEEDVLSEIKEELRSSGYVPKENQSGRRSSKKADPQKKDVSYKYITASAKDGHVILIGKNNRQNDCLTFKVAEKWDLWFHVKNAPGPHVILKAASRNEIIPEGAIMDAAELAAGYSSVGEKTKALVDFTKACYVKKPQGARPGMVIYTNQKTVSVLSRRLPEGG